MLNKERVQKESIAAQIQHVAVESTRHDSWKKIKNYCTKRRSEVNTKFMNNELVNTKDVVATANRFTALVTDSNTTSNAVGKKPTCENVPCATDSCRKREIKNPELVYPTTVGRQKGLNANANAKPNLKTHSVTQQNPCNRKEGGYPIPNLINGQISSKVSSMNIKQTSSQHKRMKHKSTTMPVSP